MCHSPYPYPTKHPQRQAGIPLHTTDANRYLGSLLVWSHFLSPSITEYGSV